MMIPYTWFTEAQARLVGHIQQTPLTYDASLDTYFKWENHQATGSFKVRGALNKVLGLQDWEQQRGLVAASAGNHGQGVALAGRLVGAPVIIFASEHAVPAKVEAMRSLGASVHLVPGGYGEAEQAGLEYARQNQATWISPYNDGQVIAGQGTLGLETLAQLPPLAQTTWVIPLGGGGLAAGIGAALKAAQFASEENAAVKLKKYPPLPKVVAVQSEASPFFHAIFQHGSQMDVKELPSLADGLSGPVENHSLTIPLVRRLVDDIRLVSEAEIAQAIQYAWHTYHERIEGSAATTLAGILSGKIPERPAVLIISGGNIQPETFQQITGSAKL
jgi:threonine dehydratase